MDLSFFETIKLFYKSLFLHPHEFRYPLREPFHQYDRLYDPEKLKIENLIIR